MKHFSSVLTTQQQAVKHSAGVECYSPYTHVLHTNCSMLII